MGPTAKTFSNAFLIKIIWDFFFMINHVGLNDRNNIENGEPTVMTSSNDFMLNIVTDG
jgi:hypothetical protein